MPKTFQDLDISKACWAARDKGSCANKECTFEHDTAIVKAARAAKKKILSDEALIFKPSTTKPKGGGKGGGEGKSAAKGKAGGGAQKPKGETPCRFFKAGSCKKGGACDFSHSEKVHIVLEGTPAGLDDAIENPFLCLWEGKRRDRSSSWVPEYYVTSSVRVRVDECKEKDKTSPPPERRCRQRSR